MRKMAKKSLKSSLRQRAEKQLHLRDAEEATYSSDLDNQRIIHELQVHQIEVDMQFEQLKEAQIEIEGERKKYKELYDFAPIGYLTLDEQAVIQDSNLAAAALLGVERSRLINRRFNLFISEDESSSFYNFLKGLFAGSAKRTLELKILKKSGPPVFVQFTADLSEDGQYCQAALMDITERKEMEKALEISESKYRTIFENSGTAMSIIDENTVILEINSRFEQLFGYAREELTGRSWTNFVPPKDLPQLLEYRKQGMIDPGEAPRTYELQLVTKSGQLRDIYATVVRMPGSMKNLASYSDITSLKESERALRRSEELFRNLFDNVPIGMYRSTLEGRFLLVNKALASILGYDSPEEVLSTVTDIATQVYADPGDRGRILAALEHKQWVYMEMAFLHKTGTDVIVRVGARRVLKEDGTGYLEGIIEDITLRRKAEEELDIKTRNLMDMNTALKVLVDRVRKEEEESRQRVLENLKADVLPYVERLKKTHLDKTQKQYLELVEEHLQEISSSFPERLGADYSDLSKREIEIASLVKDGKSSKEIAEILMISPRTIESYRRRIREKLGLKNERKDLANLLKSRIP